MKKKNNGENSSRTIFSLLLIILSIAILAFSMYALVSGVKYKLPYNIAGGILMSILSYKIFRVGTYFGKELI